LIGVQLGGYGATGMHRKLRTDWPRTQAILF
jgi:hypothetical protein